MAQNGQPFTAVRSVEPIVPNFRRKSFNVSFVSFPACYKILSAVFWQKLGPKVKAYALYVCYICCLLATLKSHGPYHTSSGGKRRSRDDLDMFLNRRPDCPPPRLPPKTQPHQHMLNSYDLNALSCTDSVKDAVHFYQNIGNIVRQRP